MAEPSRTLIDTASGEVVEATENVLLERISGLERDLSSAERDLRSKRRIIAKLERDKERERANFEDRQVVIELFEFWQRRTKRPRSRLTGDRFDALKGALESGYTPRQIALAIAGAAYDCFETQAKNGRIVRHNDLELVLRDGKHIEAFANRAPIETARRAGAGSA